MLNRLSILFSLALLAGSGVAAAQPQPPQKDSKVCDLMSREEMQVCLITKPGDATGARSVRCDQVSRAAIEACLKQQSSDAAAKSPVASASNGAATGDSQRR